MYNDYAEAVDFYVVYIREAHAADSVWPMKVEDEENPINTPRTMDDKRAVAGKCVLGLKLDVPCLVDDMNDTAEKLYDAWPDRLFVIDETGRIVVRGDPGPWGFDPSVAAATAWLESRFPGVRKVTLNEVH